MQEGKQSEKKMNNLTKTFIWVVVGLVIMWLPFTRQIVLLILPLGSGVDDLIFFVLLFLALLLLLLKWSGLSIEKIRKWLYKE